MRFNKLSAAATGISPFAVLASLMISRLSYAQTGPIVVPPNFTHPQEQASAMAVPPAAPAPSSALLIVACNKAIGLLIADTEGTLHPINVEGWSKEDVTKVLQSVPASRVISANVGCADVSKDVTVL